MVFLDRHIHPKLGFHLSVSGSFSNAAAAAIENNYDAFQIFVTNPRTWAIKGIGEKDSARFMSLVKESGIMPFAHIPYLCNPSSQKKEVLDKSTVMLSQNMDNCASLGIKYLVIHIGSHLGAGFDAALKSLKKSISSALENNKGVTLLLENSAGYKNSVGSKFEDIGKIIDEIDSRNIGVCLDTCHTFAAGYDISTKEGTIKLMDEIESAIGLERIKCVHLNDSKFGLGSGLDRHWYIGRGFIGENGFVAFFSNSRLKTEYFIMETPFQKDNDDIYNMEMAKKLMRKAGYQI